MIGVTKYFKSSLIQNTFFLFINKGVNAVVPIILIPLCNNFFGVEQYGNLIFAQATLGLLIVFADYSFSVSAPRDISANAHDFKKVSTIFSSIYSIKIIFGILGFLILLLFPLFFNNSHFNLQLFTYVYLALLLQSFLPFWFFQGVKKNHLITSINLLSKVVFISLIFLIAIKQKEIYWIPLIEFSAYVFALILSLFVLFKNFDIRFQFAGIASMFKQLKGGWSIFIIILLYWMINGGSIMLVKSFSTDEELGYFSVFSRVGYYLFAIFQPIIFSVVPFMTEKFVKSTKKEAYQYFNKIFKYFLLGASFITLVLIFVSDLIFKHFFNQIFYQKLSNYNSAFYILLIWIFFLLVNNFMAMQLLIASSKDKLFRLFLSLNAVLVTILFFILIPIYKSQGAAISMLCGELLFFLLIMGYYIKDQKN